MPSPIRADQLRARRREAPRDTAPASTADSAAAPAPGADGDVTDRQRAQLARRHEEALRRATSGALLGVIGVNTLAPAWAPAVLGGPGPLELAARAAMTVEQRRHPNATPQALQLQAVRDTRAMFAEVDARLRAVDARLEKADAALGAPAGTTRAALLERVLVSAGLDAASATTLAHGTLRSEALVDVLKRVEATLQGFGVDHAELVVGLARVADQLASNEQVELAFVLGSLAVLPDVSPAIPATARAVRAGIDGYTRHRAAIEQLKHPGTGHAAIDNAGRVLGEAADLVAHGIAFFGPFPFLKLARGADVMLILADCIAAKTAVAGSVKTLTTYSGLPTELMAFMLGAISTASLQRETADAKQELAATSDHVRVSASEIHAALRSGDPHVLVQALHHASSTMTPGERAAVAAAVRVGVESLARLGG